MSQPFPCSAYFYQQSQKHNNYLIWSTEQISFKNKEVEYLRHKRALNETEVLKISRNQIKTVERCQRRTKKQEKPALEIIIKQAKVCHQECLYQTVPDQKTSDEKIQDPKCLWLDSTAIGSFSAFEVGSKSYMINPKRA